MAGGRCRWPPRIRDVPPSGGLAERMTADRSGPSRSACCLNLSHPLARATTLQAVIYVTLNRRELLPGSWSGPTGVNRMTLPPSAAWACLPRRSMSLSSNQASCHCDRSARPPAGSTRLDSAFYSLRCRARCRRQDWWRWVIACTLSMSAEAPALLARAYAFATPSCRAQRAPPLIALLVCLLLPVEHLGAGPKAEPELALRHSQLLPRAVIR